MRMRIATAAVLVIGSAAWAFAQREERPKFYRNQAPTRVPVAAEEVPPPLSPESPSVRELRELPPATPTARTHADPDEAATSFVMRAKAEIERLEREKKTAEIEMARAKAKLQAAEAGIARWASLARAVSGAIRESRQAPTAALPDESLPVGETSLTDPPVTRLPDRRIEDLPAPGPIEELPSASEPLDLPRAPATTP